jgi:predicted metalloprotease
MRWQSGDGGNIEDLRGRRVMRGGTLGVGGLLLVAALSYFTGIDFSSLVTDVSGPPQTEGAPGEVKTTPEEDRRVKFVDAVAQDTQDTWERLLGPRYQRTKVALFRDAVDSACGMAQSATGPFYCPGDQKVYLDLGFFDELSQQFGAPGEFAQAYVIAHEFGHHVQNLLGTNEHVRQDARPGANSASVALELQADCYAGVWGHAASQSRRPDQIALEPGDAEAGLRAAAAIGDDRLQKMATGRVAPERFTHGSSAQRMEWFQRGLQTGDPAQCDTFRSRP